MSGARWGAPCDTCDFIISVDGDGKPVPDPAEWDSFPGCPVCGSTVSFDEQGQTQWQRETRLMKAAAKTGTEKALRDAADDWRAAQTHRGDDAPPDPIETWLRDRADRIGSAS